MRLRDGSRNAALVKSCVLSHEWWQLYVDARNFECDFARPLLNHIIYTI